MAKAFPTDNPFLKGYFAPVNTEADAGHLQISGEMTRELCGTLYRNGPNPETLCHSGWGGSGAFGDPATGMAGAYIMNKQGTHLLEDARRSRIIDALYGCL